MTLMPPCEFILEEKKFFYKIKSKILRILPKDPAIHTYYYYTRYMHPTHPQIPGQKNMNTKSAKSNQSKSIYVLSSCQSCNLQAKRIRSRRVTI